MIDGVIDGTKDQERSVKGIRAESPGFNALIERQDFPNGGEYRDTRVVLAPASRVEIVIDKAAGQ